MTNRKSPERPEQKRVAVIFIAILLFLVLIGLLLKKYSIVLAEMYSLICPFAAVTTYMIHNEEIRKHGRAKIWKVLLTNLIFFGPMLCLDFIQLHMNTFSQYNIRRDIAVFGGLAISFTILALNFCIGRLFYRKNANTKK